MRNSIVVVVGLFILSLLAANKLFSDPKPHTPQERIDHGKSIGDHRMVRGAYNDLIKEDSTDIDYYYHFLRYHFKVPKLEKEEGEVVERRNDKWVAKKIRELKSHAREEIRDIGYICAAFFLVKQGKYSKALKELDQVSEEDKKYLNYFYGVVYAKKAEPSQAVPAFEREMETGGYRSGTVFRLSKYLNRTGEFGKLQELIEDDERSAYIPFSVKMDHFLREMSFFGYYSSMFQLFYYHLGWLVFISALGVSLFWAGYVTMIDVYEKEDWGHVFLVFFLGMLFSFLVWPLSDSLNEFIGFEEGTGYLSKLLYQILAVGAVEEFVKILPLLLFLRYSGVINEPFDYILYASISALGFAFVENILYFSSGGVEIMFMRCLLSVVGHMFFSSVIAYGLILNRYKRRWNPVLNFILFFLMAASIHGLSNFSLSLGGNRIFNFIPLLFFLVNIGVWNAFKENALNHSEFFDKDKDFKAKKYADYLLYGLSGVLLFQYLALSMKHGPTYGNDILLKNIDGGFYLLVAVTQSVENLRPKKGKWAKVDPWNAISRIRYSRKEHYDQVVGENVELLPFSKHRLAKKYLPNKAKVTERMTVSNEEDWYLLELKKHADIQDYLSDRVLVRTKDKPEILEEGKENMIALYLIPSEEDLEKEPLSRKDLVCVHWAVLKW